MLRYSYENVNEMGETYDKHDTLQDALTMLGEYPNDCVVITLVDDPALPTVQVLADESLTAAQALRQCLYVLAHINEVRRVIELNAPTMLTQLDDVLNMTKTLAGTAATEFIVNPYTIEEAADG